MHNRSKVLVGLRACWESVALVSLVLLVGLSWIVRSSFSCCHFNCSPGVVGIVYWLVDLSVIIVRLLINDFARSYPSSSSVNIMWLVTSDQNVFRVLWWTVLLLSIAVSYSHVHSVLNISFLSLRLVSHMVAALPVHSKASSSCHIHLLCLICWPLIVFLMAQLRIVVSFLTWVRNSLQMRTVVNRINF